MQLIPRTKGFSLIEVMVTVVITGIGLLGLAAMLTTDVSNTTIARERSLAAVQASSLASAMSANPAYWAAGLAPQSFTVTGSTLGDSTLNAQTTDCTTTACTPLQMAAYDLQTWGKSLAALLPNGSGLVQCTTTTGIPVSCQVTVKWSESSFGLSQTSGPPTTTNPNYTIIVQP